MAKQKFYVVWEGVTPGIYNNWPDCQAAIKGFSNARFKSFSSRDAAELAYGASSDDYYGKDKKVKTELTTEQLKKFGKPIPKSLCVDAAWNAETKVMEYQGVWLDDSVTAFSKGPFEQATNNIGEFLAIVHALAYLKEHSLDVAIYTDSRTAMSWIRKRRVNSKAMAEGKTSARVNQLCDRALSWLRNHAFGNPILKWETKAWGEIPADFGRK